MACRGLSLNPTCIIEGIYDAIFGSVDTSEDGPLAQLEQLIVGYDHAPGNDFMFKDPGGGLSGFVYEQITIPTGSGGFPFMLAFAFLMMYLLLKFGAFVKIFSPEKQTKTPNIFSGILLIGLSYPLWIIPIVLGAQLSTIFFGNDGFITGMAAIYTSGLASPVGILNPFTWIRAFITTILFIVIGIMFFLRKMVLLGLGLFMPVIIAMMYSGVPRLQEKAKQIYIRHLMLSILGPLPIVLTILLYDIYTDVVGPINSWLLSGTGVPAVMLFILATWGTYKVLVMGAPKSTAIVGAVAGKPAKVGTGVGAGAATGYATGNPMAGIQVGSGIASGRKTSTARGVARGAGLTNRKTYNRD